MAGHRFERITLSAAYKCVVILSDKCSGSTALQDLVTEFTSARCVTHTRHIYSETLFWCKAASVLDRPQVKLLNSEVPIPSKRARSDLVTLLRENLGAYEDPESDDELVFEGWRLLCEAFAPVFLEKSRRRPLGPSLKSSPTFVETTKLSRRCFSRVKPNISSLRPRP